MIVTSNKSVQKTHKEKPKSSSHNIIVADLETGGTNWITDELLSVGLVAVSDFKIVDQAEILIYDGSLRVTAKALEINKINLEKHKQVALTPRQGAIKIIDFFKKNSTGKAKVLGHNFGSFDAPFLTTFFRRCNIKHSEHPSFAKDTKDLWETIEWDSLAHYRYIDTAGIASFLQQTNLLSLRSSSLDVLAEALNVTMDRADRHTALGDSIFTLKVYQAIIEKFKK